jgi:1-acyl-sn-glycerol-3-phosphate acyltransferase
MLLQILPLVSVAREKSFYKGMAYPQPYMYGGLWFKLLGALEVTPRSAQDPKHEKEDVLALHATLLQKGFSVLIFPEGHITRDGELMPPKLGAVKLSQRTQKPLVPVALSGSFELHPWKLITGRTHVIVTFTRPIYPRKDGREFDDDYYINVATGMMRRIAQALKSTA